MPIVHDTRNDNQERVCSHHSRMHRVLDEGLVYPAIQVIFLKIKACRQLLTHDAHGQLAGRKMCVIDRHTFRV